jgi:hypothetical protein
MKTTRKLIDRGHKMLYALGLAVIAAICYYFQFIWAAYFFAGAATLITLVNLFCWGVAVWYFNRMFGGMK